MIDERGLVAAIKDTWRHEGYAVAGYGSGDERRSEEHTSELQSR